jgi:hypothetical protein
VRLFVAEVKKWPPSRTLVKVKLGLEGGQPMGTRQVTDWAGTAGFARNDGDEVEHTIDVKDVNIQRAVGAFPDVAN